MPQDKAQLAPSGENTQRLFSAASHDLQEPLRKIVSFGELLERRAGPTLDASSRQFLDRMLQAARRMSRLVEDLRRYSKLGDPPPEASRIDLHQTADEAVRALRTAIADSGAVVEVGALPAIEADPTMMRVLFDNLISNAVKFRQKDRAPRVRVDGRDRGDSVEITVTDNGIGFEPRFADEILEPFHRLNPRADFDGSGIGLAICKKIVELHGGSLRARATPGEGATFTASLPKRRPS